METTILPVLVIILFISGLFGCEKPEQKSTAAPATSANQKAPVKEAEKEAASPVTPPASLAWPPYKCPVYAAATPTTQHNIDQRALKLIKIGDSLDTMNPEAKALLLNTDKVTSKTDVIVDGCAATIVYSYEAEQIEDSGTSTAFSYRFWICDDEVNKISFCPGIDGI